MKFLFTCGGTAGHINPALGVAGQIRQLMPDAEILYFDPSATIIAPLRDKSTKPLMTAWKSPGEKVRDNITVYRLPPVLPFCMNINPSPMPQSAEPMMHAMKLS